MDKSTEYVPADKPAEWDEPHQSIVERVMKMEAYLDEILNAADKGVEEIQKNPQLAEKLETLISYYEQGQWMKDYAYDEAGKLPKGLKRGVLSEDTLYNLFADLNI